MARYDNQDDRREFFRIHFDNPIQFKSYPKNRLNQTSADPASDGMAENISQSGILFQTDKNPPELSSILWMNMDLRTLKICQEIENRALVFNNGILGRVVRVEEDADGNAYDIGVCFLKKGQKDAKEVQEILSELSISKK